MVVISTVDKHLLSLWNTGRLAAGDYHAYLTQLLLGGLEILGTEPGTGSRVNWMGSRLPIGLGADRRTDYRREERLLFVILRSACAEPSHPSRLTWVSADPQTGGTMEARNRLVLALFSIGVLLALARYLGGGTTSTPPSSDEPALEPQSPALSDPVAESPLTTPPSTH